VGLRRSSSPEFNVLAAGRLDLLMTVCRLSSSIVDAGVKTKRREPRYALLNCLLIVSWAGAKVP